MLTCFVFDTPLVYFFILSSFVFDAQLVYF